MASFSRKLRNFLTDSKIRQFYVRWRLQRLIGREPFIRLPEGGRGYASNKFNDFYGIAVQHPTDAEFKTFQIMLADGGVYCDVGANMGLTTVLAWKTGKTNRLLAFEPTHRYAAVWHKNIEANGVRGASLFQCALGDEYGTFDFIVNPNAPMHNRLNLGITSSRYNREKGDSTVVQPVAVTRIDSICESLGINELALLKIDVEGAEPRVLRGAKRLLERQAIHAIYLEFVPEFMREMNEDVGSYVDFIYSHGYQAVRIENDGSLGHSMSPRELMGRQFDGLNVALLPRKHFSNL